MTLTSYFLAFHSSILIRSVSAKLLVFRRSVFLNILMKKNEDFLKPKDINLNLFSIMFSIMFGNINMRIWSKVALLIIVLKNIQIFIQVEGISFKWKTTYMFRVRRKAYLLIISHFQMYWHLKRCCKREGERIIFNRWMIT